MAVGCGYIAAGGLAVLDGLLASRKQGPAPLDVVADERFLEVSFHTQARRALPVDLGINPVSSPGTPASHRPDGSVPSHVVEDCVSDLKGEGERDRRKKWTGEERVKAREVGGRNGRTEMYWAETFGLLL